MVNRLLVNLRFPRTNEHTHSGLRVWVRVGGNIAKAAFDPMRDNLAAYRERQRPPQTWRRIPNLARQAKGSEGDLHRSDNLLCEQRRNQSRLPFRVGRRDANAVGWGSEVVIVVGVTSHQGVRENRTQGEGPQNSMFQVNPKQAAVGRITKLIRKELPDEQCRGRNGTPAQPRQNRVRNAGCAETVRRGTRCWIIDTVNKSSKEHSWVI